MQSDITYIGITNGRQPFKRFGILLEDRFSHIYIIGKTGTGKSTLLESIALQDIAAGRGVAVIDPHGDLVKRIHTAIPDSRTRDVVYFDVTDPNLRYGYNPLRQVALRYVPLAVSGLLESFKKMWSDAWGTRMEHIFRNALYALIEHGGATLPDVLRILTDDEFRKSVARTLSNEQVRKFWLTEFPAYNPRYRQESIGPIQNKIGAFLADPRLYRILTSAHEDVRFRSIMDQEKVLLVNLAKGIIGEDSASLLGALLITTLSLAAFSRAELPDAGRRNFFIHIDEFQSFSTETFINMVSELRKYRIGLLLANQNLAQLPPPVRAAIFGNVGSHISFRLGLDDAKILAGECAPDISHEDILHLPNYQMYVKLMIRGAPGSPFRAAALYPNRARSEPNQAARG